MHDLLHWDEVEKKFIDTLFDWQGYASFSEGAVSLCVLAIDWTPYLLGAGVFFQFLGGLLLLLGVYQRAGAFLLILVLFPSNILLHPFWVFEGSLRDLETLFFMKDLAILGGLVFFALSEAPIEKKPAMAKLRMDRL